MCEMCLLFTGFGGDNFGGDGGFGGGDGFDEGYDQYGGMQSFSQDNSVSRACIGVVSFD